MKIKYTVELDIPDEYKEYSDAELRQLVYDECVLSTIFYHIYMYMDWLSKASKDPQDIGAQTICDFHKEWSQIKPLSFSLTKV